MSDRRVLFIGLDGADWQIIQPLLDAGKLPALQSLVDNGVSGRVASLFPTVSPILWNSIATGKRAGKHGVTGFTEVDPFTSKIRPVTRRSRKCKAVWDILQGQGHHVSVVNWFASHPAEQLTGTSISNLFGEHPPPNLNDNWPLAPGTVAPETAAAELHDARIHPLEIERETILLMMPHLADAHEDDEILISRLVTELAKAYSINTATTWILESQPWQFVGPYFRIIDLIGHMFMPFAAPQLPSIDDRRFRLFSDVVNHAYQFFDLLLTNMLVRAGDDATVILLSDHGFQSGDTRPQNFEDPYADPEAWHRNHGVLVMRGPDIRKDELIHGAGLLDIAPTILSMFDVPVGADMDGRVLVEAFDDAPKSQSVATWEDSESTSSDVVVEISDEDSDALLKQFVALGYLDPPNGDPATAVEETNRQNQWNLARDYMDASDFEAALPILEELDAADQHAPAMTFQLALCQWRLGLSSEAELSLQHLVRFAGEGPQAWFLQGVLALESGDHDTAVTKLEQTFEAVQGNWIRGLGWALGRAYLSMERWTDAEKAFRNAIEHEPDSGFASQGLAHVLLKQGRYHDAAEAAMNALSLHHNLPWAHLFLGQALERLDLWDKAEQAFRVAISYRAEFPEAFRELARLLKKLPGRATEAEEFQRKAAVYDTDFHSVLVEERRKAAQARSQGRMDDLWSQQQQRPDTAASDHQVPVSPGPVKDVIIVSGLPRSGTSMMMQMLNAAGIPVLTDELRSADEFNPHGYFEWAPAKELEQNPDRIAEANGKAVKLVSVLLPSLPETGHYKVIFMQRPVIEVARSQQAMLDKSLVSQPESVSNNTTDLVTTLERHRSNTLHFLSKSPDRFDVLEVSYHAVLADPETEAKKICNFLQKDDSSATAMAQAIHPELNHPEYGARQ